MKIIKKLTIVVLLCSLIICLSACGKEEEIKTAPNELFINIDDMMQYANDSWTMSELITRLFPNYVIYTDGDNMLRYQEKNMDLLPSVYDFSIMSTDDQGFKVYDKDNPQKMSWKGIDVSAYQGDIDWEKVKESGIEYAFIRIGYRGYTEGVLQFDNKFEQNIEGALENGIQVGVYFVTQAINEKEAKEEAEWVMNAIRQYDVTWPVVYDVEGNSAKDARARNNTADQNTKNIIAFCDCIKAGGYTPMIYSNTRWLISEMDIAKLQDYDVWFAFYKDYPFYPYSYQIWQYSDSGHVDGVSGNVDQNVSFVNYGK